MPFTAEQLQAIDATGEVHIETRSGDRTYRTIIWVVTDGEEVFIRSVHGKAGRWYQRTLADPDVKLDVAGTKLPANAVPASDPESVARTTEALQRKYKHSSSLASMIKPEVLATTLRLEPVP